MIKYVLVGALVVGALAGCTKKDDAAPAPSPSVSSVSPEPEISVVPKPSEPDAPDSTGQAPDEVRSLLPSG